MMLESQGSHNIVLSGTSIWCTPAFIPCLYAIRDSVFDCKTSGHLIRAPRVRARFALRPVSCHKVGRSFHQRDLTIFPVPSLATAVTISCHRLASDSKIAQGLVGPACMCILDDAWTQDLAKLRAILQEINTSLYLEKLLAVWDAVVF